MAVKFSSHCVYQIRYQLVMCVKYRNQMLRRKAYQETLVGGLREIGKRYWYESEEIGSDGDHVHIFVGAAGRWAPSRIMQVLKSLSAREMFRAHPEIRKTLWGGEFWSDGGYIGTVGGGTTEEIVRKYIQRQGSPSEKALYGQLVLFR
jgi:putative transposase